jgi:tyrosinase
MESAYKKKPCSLVIVKQQYLSKHIHAVAAKYTGALAAKYQKAADSVRLPFWDWAIDKQLPIALIRTNVTITGPDGAPLTIPNPLLKYRFQQFPLNATLFPPNYDLNLASFPETERCPDPVSRMSNPVRVDANILAIDMAETVVSISDSLFPLSISHEHAHLISKPWMIV